MGRAAEESLIARANLLTYPRLAVAIKAIKDEDPVHATRLIRQAIQELSLLSDPADIAAFHEEPPSTGDHRWDALITGVAVHTWSLANDGAFLPWARKVQPLAEIWEPGNGPERWRGWNLIHTPPSLIALNVCFPQEWLGAV